MIYRILLGILIFVLGANLPLSPVWAEGKPIATKVRKVKVAARRSYGYAMVSGFARAGNKS